MGTRGIAHAPAHTMRLGFVFETSGNFEHKKKRSKNGLGSVWGQPSAEGSLVPFRTRQHDFLTAKRGGGGLWEVA